MLQFAVDTGGTFTDLVVDGNGLQPRFYKRSTTPADPIDGLLDVFAAAAADHGDDLPTFSVGATVSSSAPRGRRTPSSPAATARTALLVHARPSGRPPLSRGRRPDDPLRLHAGVPGAVRPAVAHVRDPRTHPRRRLGRHTARRGRRPRGGRTTARARGRGDRGVPSLVDRQPGARAAGRRAARARRSGDPGHALPRPEPESARVPPRLVRRDRRLAQAIDEHASSASSRRPGGVRLPRSAADHDLRRWRARRAPRSPSSRSTRSAPGRQPPRSPAATTHGSTADPTPRS